MNGLIEQTLLNVEHAIGQSFDNFVGNDDLVTELQNEIKKQQSIYITGPQASGKSHILNASLHYLTQNGLNVHKLTGQGKMPAEYHDVDWLIIDDIDLHINANWLISLSQHQSQIKWLATANKNHPLPDLQSRLNQMNYFMLQPLSNEKDLKALIHSIANRHQYSLTDQFISQCLNFLPWHAPTCIKSVMSLIKHCHQYKTKPTIRNLKTIYEND